MRKITKFVIKHNQGVSQIIAVMGLIAIISSVVLLYMGCASIYGVYFAGKMPYRHCDSWESLHKRLKIDVLFPSYLPDVFCDDSIDYTYSGGIAAGGSYRIDQTIKNDSNWRSNKQSGYRIAIWSTDPHIRCLSISCIGAVDDAQTSVPSIYIQDIEIYIDVIDYEYKCTFDYNGYRYYITFHNTTTDFDTDILREEMIKVIEGMLITTD